MTDLKRIQYSSGNNHLKVLFVLGFIFNACFSAMFSGHPNDMMILMKCSTEEMLNLSLA